MLRFVYDGADKVRRTLLVGFSLPAIVAPRTAESTTAHFDLLIEPLGSVTLVTTMRVDERGLDAAPVGARKPASAEALHRAQDEVSAHLLDGYARIVGLFGRDSLLPTIQCLAFNPDLGRHTTRALAHWQGKRDDDKTMEQPGKILHELRVGEMAHLHEVTQTPSYAAVDSTLLYLIAIARHVHWTGDMSLFEELRPSIAAALGWLDRKTAENDAGYVTYDGIADKHGQPINQSWRDSGTGVLPAPLRAGRGSAAPGACDHRRGCKLPAARPAGIHRRHPAPARRRPAHTPRADPMQAWSAAALPFMTTELLGLDIDGFAGRVTVRRHFCRLGFACCGSSTCRRKATVSCWRPRPTQAAA